MSTRGAVAVPIDGGGWRGRYVHAGAHLRPTLVAILRRDGYAAAVATLTGAHGWSTITGDPDVEVPDYLQPERFRAVPGYGLAYTDEEAPDQWVTPDTAAADWVEVVYVLTPDGVVEVEVER